MTQIEKLSALVETVRELNWEIRPKINNVPGGDPPANALHIALSDLRENELQASQLIRSMSLAETAAGMSEDQLQVVEHPDPTTIGSRQVLSEFATAREAILSIVRNLTDDQWKETHRTPNGDRTYEELVDGLIESDKTFTKRIHDASA